jgi:hypothetical protein
MAWLRGRASWQRRVGEPLSEWRERVRHQWITYVGPLPDRVRRGARLVPYLNVATLREIAATLDMLDEEYGTEAWTPVGRISRKGAFREQAYMAVAWDPTYEDFLREVERWMANPRIRQVIYRYHLPEGIPEGRTVSKLPGRGTPRQQIEKTAEYTIELISDAIVEEAELDTSWMKVGWVEQRVAGAGGRKAYKVMMTNLYTMRDYECAEGDCAFACMRAVAAKVAKKNKSLRRELSLPEGAIGFESLEALARYFRVGARVFIEATEVVEQFDDEHENRFVGAHKHKCVWEVRPREGEKVVDMYYAASHFSHITEFKEIPASSYCPITGDYGASYSNKQLKKRLREQGRHYHEPKGSAKARREHHEYKTRVLVFDFETVWDPERGDDLRPYAVAWYDFDPKTEKISGALEGSVRYEFGLDKCALALVDYISEAPDDVRYVIAGFNSSRFDNYLLARAAQSREVLTRVFATGNTLRGLWLGRHEALDIARLCPGATLKQRCSDFRTDPVKVDGFDHTVVQEEFLRGRLAQWADLNREKLEHYVKCDVLSTASLFVKLAEALSELIGIDVLEGEAQTIGGAAWKAYERSAKDEGRVKHPAPTREVDDFFRSAIVGGRVQSFKKSGHTVRGRLRMVDVASLYPTVMYGKNGHLMPPSLLYGQFPRGDPVATERYIPGLIGFYNVRVKRQPIRNVLPKRLPDGRLDWRYQGEFDTVATQCSIELIRRHGGEVDVGSGYYFPKLDNKAFHTFLEPIFAAKDDEDRLAAEKSPQANASRRNMAKLLMNSLSGKTAQRNFDERVVLATGSAKQLTEEAKMRDGVARWIPLCGSTCILVGLKPLEKVYNKRTAKPSYMAALIYEYSRAYMYELLLSKYDVQYMDTDSSVMASEEYERFRQDYPELDFNGITKRPKQLGDLEEELGHPEDATAILLGPKEYLIHNHTKGVTKARLKGINLGRDRLVPDVTRVPRETLALHRLYEALPLATPLELFEGLAGGARQRLLCSQLQRTLVGSEGALFSLRQRYLVKTLEPRKTHDREVPAMRSELYRRLGP